MGGVAADIVTVGIIPVAKQPRRGMWSSLASSLPQ